MRLCNEIMWAPVVSGRMHSFNISHALACDGIGFTSWSSSESLSSVLTVSGLVTVCTIFGCFHRFLHCRSFSAIECDPFIFISLDITNCRLPKTQLLRKWSNGSPFLQSFANLQLLVYTENSWLPFAGIHFCWLSSLWLVRINDVRISDVPLHCHNKVHKVMTIKDVFLQWSINVCIRLAT